MTDVTTQELDSLADTLRDAVDEYKAADAVAKELNRKVNELKFDFMNLLDKAGKSSYTAEGIAQISKVDKISITVPKTHSEKSELFKWLKEEMGADGFLQYATVNSNSLNALYNSKLEEEGNDAASFRIPGAGEPTVRSVIRFSKR